MAEFNETVIDHVGGIGCSDDWCGVSTGEMALKSKLEQLAKKYPDEVECISENDDGSVYYHVPWNWVKIYNPKKKLTEEQIRERVERINKAKADRKNAEKHQTV